MIESPLIARLLANARAEAKAAALLRVLRKRYREFPEDLATSVRACADGVQLDLWLDALGKAETLEQFCQQTGLEARRGNFRGSERSEGAPGTSQHGWCFTQEDDDTTARDEDGYPIIESPFIAELLADARRKARVKARLRGQAEMFLLVIQHRYRTLPDELAASICACTDGDQLARWLRIALTAQTLEQFRQQTGL